MTTHVALAAETWLFCAQLMFGQQAAAFFTLLHLNDHVYHAGVRSKASFKPET